MYQNINWWERNYKLKEKNKSFLVYPDEDLVRIVKKFFIPAGVKNVLDLGCGSGRHCMMMLAEGLSVIGIDSSETSIQNARKMISPSVNEDNRFLVQDISNNLPFEDKSIDGVVCWGVLHYLTQDKAKTVLDEVNRILKPGGLFTLTLRSTEDSECKSKEITDIQTSYALESTGLNFRYYTQENVFNFLSSFENIKCAHKARTFPENPNRIIAHWMVVCNTKS